MFYGFVGTLLSDIDNGVAQENKIYPIKFMLIVKLSINPTCNYYYYFDLS